MLKLVSLVKSKSVILLKSKFKFATVAQGISTRFIPCLQAQLHAMTSPVIYCDVIYLSNTI